MLCCFIWFILWEYAFNGLITIGSELINKLSDLRELIDNSRMTNKKPKCQLEIKGVDADWESNNSSLCINHQNICELINEFLSCTLKKVKEILMKGTNELSFLGLPTVKQMLLATFLLLQTISFWWTRERLHLAFLFSVF